MCSLLYLVIGDRPALRRELDLSLLSLDRCAGPWTRENVTVRIYSDRPIELPETFTGLDVNVQVLTADELQEAMKCGNDFILALKPWVIRHCLNKTKGAVLFVDTDTCFIKDPAPLFEALRRGHLILHLRENWIKARRQMSSYFKTNKLKRLDGSRIDVSPREYMWNSGVVGIGNDRVALLDEVMNFIRQLSENQRWHVMEQLAFSIFWARAGRVIEADRYVFHYWFFRHGAHALAGYFGILSDDERREAVSLGYDPARLSSMAYEHIPDEIMRVAKRNEMTPDWLFWDLPARTFTGRRLRRVFCTDLASLVFLVKTEIKYFIGRDGLVNEKTYK